MATYGVLPGGSACLAGTSPCWYLVGAEKFTSPLGGKSPSLAFNPGNNQPYLAYLDTGTPARTSAAAYGELPEGSSCLAGTSPCWYPVLAYNSIGISVRPFLSFNIANNQPYLAYVSDGLNVITYGDLPDGQTCKIGTSPCWYSVGAANFANSSGTQVVTFHPNNHQPYVAYSNGNAGSKISVAAYGALPLGSTCLAGSSPCWYAVGGGDFSDGAGGAVGLAISPQNYQPYVSYRDNANNNGATVMTYDGTTWKVVGSKNFSNSTPDAGVLNTSIMFHPLNNQPYVMYSDFDTGRVTVMR